MPPGPWRPHVTGTLMRYLDCGDFSCGAREPFSPLRVACTSPGYRHEFLVPFSCKRAICLFMTFVRGPATGRVSALAARGRDLLREVAPQKSTAL